MIECGQNYSINLETNEIRNDNTDRILKQGLNNRGYYQAVLCMNGKRKKYLVHVLVWYAHNSSYDTNQYDIDHIDHCRTNNHISNLRLVSKSLNMINISQRKGKQFDYKSELPDATIINEEFEIYYFKQYDKFYRKVSESQYREIHERKLKNKNSTRIEWQLNNIKYSFTTSNYRDLI